MEKYHKQDVAPIERENERDENYKADNPQIDKERTKGNYRFTPHFGKSYTEFINERIQALGLSPRKDAVVMSSFVVGSDKAFFDGLPQIQQYNFFRIVFNSLRNATAKRISLLLLFTRMKPRRICTWT